MVCKSAQRPANHKAEFYDRYKAQHVGCKRLNPIKPSKNEPHAPIDAPIQTETLPSGKWPFYATLGLAELEVYRRKLLYFGGGGRNRTGVHGFAGRWAFLIQQRPESYCHSDDHSPVPSRMWNGIRATKGSRAIAGDVQLLSEQSHHAPPWPSETQLPSR